MIGQRIKDIRLENKLSQQAMADILGVTSMSISNYEKGFRVPDCNFLKKFAACFDVSTDYLLGLNDNKDPKNTPIGNRLGLSDNSVDTLERLTDDEQGALSLQLINDILSSTELQRILQHLNTWVAYKRNNHYSDAPAAAETQEEHYIELLANHTSMHLKALQDTDIQNLSEELKNIDKTYHKMIRLINKNTHRVLVYELDTAINNLADTLKKKYIKNINEWLQNFDDTEVAKKCLEKD